MRPYAAIRSRAGHIIAIFIEVHAAVCWPKRIVNFWFGLDFAHDRVDVIA